MKKIHALPILMPVIAFSILSGCSTQRRLEEAYMVSGLVNVRQPANAEKKTEENKVETGKHITFKDKDGQEKTVMTSVRDSTNGEYMLTSQLDEVTVTAKSKTVPERNGNITIAFMVSVPETYTKKDWRVTIHPTLDNEGEKHELKSVVVAGEQFRNMDGRRKWYEERKLNRRINKNKKRVERRKDFYPYFYRNDSTTDVLVRELDQWAEGNERYNRSWVLDTIVKNRKNLEYYYKQDFRTEEMRRKLKLYFTAKVEDLGMATYHLRSGDTLNYFISSMTQFLDRKPRYIRETVERKVTETTSAYIHFPAGSTVVDDTLHNNREEIEKVYRKMKEINEGNEFIVDSIVLIPACSPEGSFQANKILAEKRAVSLKKYLEPALQSNAETVDLVKVQYKAENWDKLMQMLSESDIEQKEDILALIKKTQDPDERERKISVAFPDVYKKLKMEFYPKLRTVDFVFHLSRRGMVEDVMYTDVIDTEYAEAIKLMDERKYKEAMPKLLEYRDMNTAICYMSLGYNGTAVNILLEQPETADREYLLAILYARLNMEELAVQLFLKSCKMDESKIERGELDPEIAELIKENNLYNQLYN